MAEYIPAAIHIGGLVPCALAAGLAAIVFDAGASLECGGASFTPETVGHLAAAVDPDTKLLHLYDDQARWGCFEELESWLVEHGISFDRQSEANYEFDGTLVSFRPAIGKIEHTATQDGNPTVRLAELERVRELLRAALAERSPERVRAALAALDQAMGPEVSPLEPFKMIDGGL